MADSAATTVDFLRARLLSERSVSRAAKEHADQLAARVAELEEKVRAVTAQRRQAERAAAEMLANLEAQGYGLSDALDSDEENDDGARDAKSGCDAGQPKPEAAQGEAEDALSGTVQPAGGLSWKGRGVSPQKARQLRQKHRRSYFYLLPSDSSPKYKMGQSCRKNKRKELRSGAPEDEGGGVAVPAESKSGRRDGSDCTDEGRTDLDGEVGGDERSSGDGGGAQYVIRYEKDGEMERVLERQAELIGQYEAQENAQREWERRFNHNRTSPKGNVEVVNEVYLLENGQDQRNSEADLAGPEANCDAEAKSSNGSNPSPERLMNSAPSETPKFTSGEQTVEQRESGEQHGQALSASNISAQGSSNNDSTVTGQHQEQGDENSDGNPSSDTLISKVSDWSSSRFHDHTEDQLDTPSYGQASNIVDVGSVLEALQRATISLRAKLNVRPVPPSQVTLALPAPGDEYRAEEDSLADDDSSSYREEPRSSSPARQEILALPAPEHYGYHDHERMDFPVNAADTSLTEKQSNSSPPRQEILALPAPGDDYPSETEDDMKIPSSAPGLFLLPTDSFPNDEMLSSSNTCDSGFSLREAAQHNALSSRGDPAFSAKQYTDPHSSVLLQVPTSGRCNALRSDFTRGGTSFLPGKALGDANLFMQRGCDYTISNKWML